MENGAGIVLTKAISRSGFKLLSLRSINLKHAAVAGVSGINTMIPFVLNEEQFAKRYLGCLNRVSSDYIISLRELLSLSVPESVNEAEVQIFLGDDGLEPPNAWIYFQGKENKVDGSDQSIFPGRSMELPSFIDKMEDFDESYYSEEFGGIGIIANITKNWFAECWWKAGGWAYRVPTKIWVHDDFGDGECIELSEHH